jgi:WD40 repeat protein
MRRLAATIMPTAAAICLTVAVAPPAAADSPDHTFGGCSFQTENPLGGPTNTGVISAAAATFRPDGTPIDATVSCKIRVNLVDAPGTELDVPGFGTQVDARPISFSANDGDIVALCQRTAYADGTVNDWSCPTAITLQVPPQEIIDDINFLFGVVNNITIWDVDWRLCPVLAAHPGTYGPITIGPDGDVYVPDPLGLFIGPTYDCPPYGNF